MRSQDFDLLCFCDGSVVDMLTCMLLVTLVSLWLWRDSVSSVLVVWCLTFVYSIQNNSFDSSIMKTETYLFLQSKGEEAKSDFWQSFRWKKMAPSWSGFYIAIPFLYVGQYFSLVIGVDCPEDNSLFFVTYRNHKRNRVLSQAQNPKKFCNR